MVDFNSKLCTLQFCLVLFHFLQFLSQDLPLFEGIISDLFPDVTLPTPDHGKLQHAIIDEIHKMGLQPVPWFIDKIIQVLYLSCV